MAEDDILAEAIILGGGPISGEDEGAAEADGSVVVVGRVVVGRPSSSRPELADEGCIIGEDELGGEGDIGQMAGMAEGERPCWVDAG